MQGDRELAKAELAGRTLVYLVSEDWYFCSHRLPVARAAQDAGARIVVATRLDADRERIAAEGFEPVHIPFDRSGLNPLRDFATLRAIIDCYRGFRPDLVHHVAAKPVLLGQIAASLTRVPVVVNAMAGMGFLYIAQGMKARLLRRVFEAVIRIGMRRSGSALIVQNADDAALFVERGIDAGKIALIPGSGVDATLFKPVPEPEGEPVAVCVSRMLRDKGIEELVDAARILREQGVAIRIRLVGGTDANPASIAPALLETWKQEGIVDVAGPSRDIVGEYAQAHIAVLPSYREGLPKSLLEAAACARPIVTTDVPGCRAVCNDGGNGLLVPPRDSRALAGALERLARDPETRARMGKAGRRRVEAEFAETIIAEETMQLYRNLLSRVESG